MDNNTSPAIKPKMSAGDRFIHLGAYGSLYVCVVAILTLLYTVINAAFPPVNPSIYSYVAGSSISYQVATMIVFFPIFLLLSWIIQKHYALDPAIKETSFRKGLVFLTLLISGFSMAVDLVTIIYSFLNGDDFTAGFVLKALSVLVVFGGIFIYYLQDVRNHLTTQMRNSLRILSLMLVIGAIIWGFGVLGSPRTQRYQRLDQQKVYDLQGIQSQTLNYYQQKGVLPESITDLNNSLSYYTLPKDAQTGQYYEYHKTGDMSFELCANFNANQPSQVTNMFGYTPGSNDNWQYTKGHYCFARTIDPQLYPIYNAPTAPSAAPAKR